MEQDNEWPPLNKWSIGFLVLVILFGVYTQTDLGPVFQNLFASSASSSLSEAPAIAFFMPHKEGGVAVGETANIDVNINTRIPVNTFGAVVTYDSDNIEIVGVSKERSFMDLWVEDTTIKESAREIRFSGGTTVPGGIVGTGTAFTVSVRAKREGTASFTLKDIELYPSNGSGVLVPIDTRTLTLTLKPAPILAFGGTSITPPNPDFDGDGKITLVDISILAIRLIGSYNPRYDLDNNGVLNLSDMGILIGARN